MPKESQSQWNFGELFSEEQTREVLTVSELTTRVKRTLEGRVGEVWVEGEITGLRSHGSGHMYFSVKDAKCQLACVLFRGTRVAQRELMEDGQKVVLRGDLTVYEPQGKYQLRVQSVDLQGVGALQAQFEKLKQRLKAEGLFDEQSKKELPRFPQRIGIVTSLNAAALRDVVHVIQRRQPALQMVIAATRVQGQGAEGEIAQAINQLNKWSATERVNLILVTRGGGSLEDLWAFNEEAVARAIHASVLPVVSAVGHEIDFTISDFTADLRAATPSAAAEIITAGAVTLRESMAETSMRMNRAVQAILTQAKRETETAGHRLLRCHPRRRLGDHMQRVDELHDDLLHAAQTQWTACERNWRQLSQRLLRARPAQALRHMHQRVDRLSERLQERARLLHGRSGQRVKGLAEELRLLGPENVLARGYSITCDANTGKVVRSVGQVKSGQSLRTRLADGEIDSTVS